MKKILRNILIIMLTVTAAVCAAVGLSACGVKLTGLRIDNAKTDFKVGDTFEKGEGFKVYALFSDNTENDVTEEAVIRAEAALDTENMSVAGDYQITVSWGGKKEVYTIYVSEFDNILRKIELDSTQLRKNYSLGENVTFDGLKINCTYENAQGKLIQSTETSVKNFKVVIKDDDGYVVTDVYDKLGEFTVTVSLGSVSDSFTVNVDGVNIDTVQGAIFAGVQFKDKVVSGTHEVRGDKNDGDGNQTEYQIYDYVYEFGDNYTYVHETNETPDNEYHYSIENSQITCVQLQGGKIIQNNGIQTGMMEGTPYFLWYNRLKVFGPENLLTTLYKAAKTCTNKDLVETADPVKREYSFSFSGLVFISSNNDYYETSVSFKLSEDYTVEHLEFTQDNWQDSTGNASGKPPTFTTDASGHTTPNGRYSVRYKHTTDQIVGERTKTNPYSPEAMKVKSYDLKYDGQSLGDSGVITCDISTKSFIIEIADISPSTASLENDLMYFNYEGNYGDEVVSTTVIYCEGFSAYRNGNIIKVYPKNGGVWTLKIRTSGTYKTVTFKVGGVSPTLMTAQLGNEASGKFSAGSQKTVFAGNAVYFYGAVDKYADTAQSAAVTSANASTATIEKTTLVGVDCFMFKASAAGVYTVTVTSDVVSSMKCTFTFTVNASPDYASILNGKYRVQNGEGDIFELEFTPDVNAEGVSGTLVVTRTPTDEDDNPLYDKQKTQTLNYSIDSDKAQIVLTAVSGDNLGITLSVDVNGNFMMGDQYNSLYKLNKVTE